MTHCQAIPSVRLSLKAILASQKDPPLCPRQEVEQQLTHQHKQASLSPHRLAPKPTPFHQLSQLCKLQARKRLELQPPPNEYATFKKDHLFLNKTLWTQNDSADILDGDSKRLDTQHAETRSPLSQLALKQRVVLHTPLEHSDISKNSELSGIPLRTQQSEQKSRAQILLCQLIQRLLPTPPKRTKQEKGLFEKSAQQLQLQKNIEQLNLALQHKNKKKT